MCIPNRKVKVVSKTFLQDYDTKSQLLFFIFAIENSSEFLHLKLQNIVRKQVINQKQHPVTTLNTMINISLADLFIQVRTTYRANKLWRPMSYQVVGGLSEIFGKFYRLFYQKISIDPPES